MVAAELIDGLPVAGKVGPSLLAPNGCGSAGHV